MSKRQAEIVAMVERRGYVSVDRLAAQLAVTPQTIRRDLNELCDGKFLERHATACANAAQYARYDC